MILKVKLKECITLHSLFFQLEQENRQEFAFDWVQQTTNLFLLVRHFFISLSRNTLSF